MLPGFQHMKRFWDQSRDMPMVKILPGEFYVTTQDEIVATVLGSCIAACIRDRRTGVGGMNHFMLPQSDDSSGGSWGSGVAVHNRYGNFAMESLINTILKHGGERQYLEVKLFGGGRILAQMTDVGRRNIEFVLNYVEKEHLDVSSQDLGDVCPRKVLYYPLSGRVQVKKLRAIHNDTIAVREKSYLQELQEQPVEGDVELF
jgi:chemotaxis protein CheD